MKRTILKELLAWFRVYVPEGVKGFILLLWLALTVLGAAVIKKDRETGMVNEARIKTLEDDLSYSRKRADSTQAMLMRCYEGKSNQGRDLLDLMERFERMKERSDSILNETKKLKQKWK